jgi:tetratricopeptide (TPR) repeat protein
MHSMVEFNLRDSFEKENWAILFGAGISLDSPSNTPLGYNLIDELLKVTIHNDFLSKTESLISSHVDDTKIGRFLRFETLCESIEKATGSLGFLDFFSGYNQPNLNHLNLANLMSNGSILLTTNFDCLVEAASNTLGVNVSPKAIPLDSSLKIKKNALYKLHGTAPNYSDQRKDNPNRKILTTIKGVSNPKSKEEISIIISEVSKDYNLLIVGYSGLDDFDVSPAIRGSKSDKKIVWFNHSVGVKNYTVYDFDKLINAPDSSAKHLLEDIYALGTRSSNTIFLADGGTSSLLSDIGGISVHVQSEFDNKIDFKSHISKWADKYITEIKKTIITCEILTELNRDDEALLLLKNDGQAYRILVNNNHISNNEKLVSIYVRCLIKQTPISIDEDDIIHIIDYLRSVKSKEVEFELCNYLGIYWLSQKNLKEGAIYIEMAMNLANELENSEYKVISGINYGLTMEPKDAIEHLERYVLPDAEKYNYVKWLAKLYYNLGGLKNDDKYRVKAINNSILTGDFSIMLQAMLYLAPDSIPVYREHLIRALNNGDDEKVFNASNSHEGAFFYGVISMYFTDLDYSIAEEMAIKSCSMYSLNDDYDINKHCFISDTILSIYDLQNKHKNLIDYVDSTFPDLNLITNPAALIDILYFLSKSHYFVGNKKQNEKYLQKLKAIIKLQENVSLYINLQEYYFDIGEYQNSFEYYKIIISGCTCRENLYKTLELAGNCHYNMGNSYEAKKLYLEASTYLSEGITPSSAIFYNLARICIEQDRLLSSAMFFILSKLLGGHNMTVTEDKKSTESYIINRIGNDVYSLVENRVKLKMKSSESFFELCVRSLSLEKESKNVLDGVV